MNLKLKGRITERFNTSRNFSRTIKQDAAVVSKVIHNKIDLPQEEKQRWAEYLGCDSSDIFGSGAGAG